MGAEMTPRELESGQSLVEFTFGLIILLMLVVGIVDASRALITYLAMRDAAQEGALYGSTDPTNTTAIRERVRDSSDLMQDICPGDVTNCDDPGDPVYVDVQVGAACMGEGITVTIHYYEFPLVMPLIGAVVGGQTVPISASVTDTILRPPC